MAFRTYSAEHGVHNISFNYIKDTTVGPSGTWVPLTDTHLAAGGSTGSSGGSSGGSSSSTVEPALKINTSALTNFLLAKSGTGILFSVVGYNSNTGQQYLHVFDNTSSGANLIHTQVIDGADNFGVDFGPNGIYMNTGILICNSSTVVTQTNGSADLFITAVYR